MDAVIERGGGSDQAAGTSVVPLWSVELPRGALLGDGHGGWLVATRTGLVSLAPDGGLRWQVDNVGPTWGLPVPAPGGTVVRVEGGSIVTRDAVTGQVVRSLSAPGAAWLAVAPWGGLVHSEHDPAGATLHATTFDGARLWSRPLADGVHPVHEPLAVADTLAAFDAGRLTAFDRDGNVRWSAGRDGFHDDAAASGVAVADAAQADSADGGPDELWAMPQLAGAETVLLGLRWYTGIELFLVDPAARTVVPYVSSVVARNPITVVRPVEAGLRVAAVGGRYEVRQMDYRWPVVLLDETGTVRWQHPFPTEPRGLRAGLDGSLIVSGSPSRQRWEAYGRFHDLSKDVYVCSLDADGSEQWTWHPPGPLRPEPVVVGTDGVVYVAVEDRLWALPPG